MTLRASKEEPQYVARALSRRSGTVATSTKTGASPSWMVCADWRARNASQQRKRFAGVIVLAAALGVGGCSLLSKHAVGNAAVPQPAKPVELSRYLGRWYELARYEQGFQKDCDGVTADYALREDGNVSVTNTCRNPDGSINQAKGKAKVVDTATGAKLKVSFFGPFYGDYWVLDHADDYSWSIVGEQSGRYLWLLSREANPGAVKLEALVERAKALGYDTSMLRITRQP